ncbi:L-fucose dehydrogenase [Niastella vici]|uniref:L-fucose dehydrogenase n=1 Tax=Niastella vici TaxID=1703345 RepID=A0A1V9FHN3_9BACT|nr:aldo/keto reductase [Niastella vici]OQP57787.1 L-fucose dehydrogenase [Niastella vici]
MSELNLPKVIFGTSGLGNLYVALSEADKCAIVKECIQHSTIPAVFDSAGKYGAGLSLESLGKCLRQLQVKPEDVLISNKLGWYRIPLTTAEPTFEPGVWKDIQYDAEQRISYEGILQCYEQGNELLNGYHAHLVSVHDPDEYLAAASSEADRAQRFENIKEAYRALFELKAEGKVKAIGVGAKNWKIIKEITDHIQLDWVMIANSMTLHSHPSDLLQYMQQLKTKNTSIINSAVFNGGFLTGGDYYNYKLVEAGKPGQDALLQWRKEFFARCAEYGIEPAHAGIQFGIQAPGVTSIALSTSRPSKVKVNIDMATIPMPPGFWTELKKRGLMAYTGHLD